MKNFIFLFLAILCQTSFAQLFKPEPSNVSLSVTDVDPNSLVASMGDIGAVASDNRAFTGLSQNPALLAGDSSRTGFSLNYLPWAREMVSGQNLFGAKAFMSAGKNACLGIGFAAFTSKAIDIFSYTGAAVRAHPWEGYANIAYARTLGKHFSFGAGLKLIHASMYGDILIDSIHFKPFTTFALDAGLNYFGTYKSTGNFSLNYQAGACISNFGPRVKLTDEENEVKSFQPAKLRIGAMLNPGFRLNSGMDLIFTLAYQVDRYLVPSIPIYAQENGVDVIVRGKNPDVSIFKALFQSFNDSPDGSEGERREWMHKFGFEARINSGNGSYACIDIGRNADHPYKDSFRFNTFGIGAGYKQFRLHLNYYYDTNYYLKNTYGIFLAYTTGF